MLASIRHAALLPLLVTVVRAQAADPQGADNPYGLRDWHADHPVALELPAKHAAPVWTRSRQQALERVVANLQGNTRREVWLMAMEFFDRAPDEAAELLVAALDQHFGQADVLQNVLEAMTRMPRPQFEQPLRRAIEHRHDAVRQAACAALAACGSHAALRDLWPIFLSSMNARARTMWLRAARERLGADAVPLLRQTMVSTTPPAVRDLILAETLRFAPGDTAAILEGMWEEAQGDFKAVVAGAFHAAGRLPGTSWLQNALSDQDDRLVLMALKQLQGRELGTLRDLVLRCSVYEQPEVRFELAKTLAGRAGDDVTNTFELLAGTTDLVATKCLALRELVLRGRTELVTTLLEDAKTATGSRLELLLKLLSASGDPRVVPQLCERFAGAPAEEGRSYLAALATSRAPGSTAALFAMFVAPERPLSKPDPRRPTLSTLGYLPTLLLNARGEERVLLAGFAQLPRTDRVRRALLLQTLAGIASDRDDATLRADIDALLRGILFDKAEPPQLRVQALNSLTRRVLTLDDVQRLRRHQEGEGLGEPPALQALWKDWLFEYF